MVQEANEALMLLGLVGERLGRIVADPGYGGGGGEMPMAGPMPEDILAQAPPPGAEMAGLPMGGPGEGLPHTGPGLLQPYPETPVGGLGQDAMAGGAPPVGGPGPGALAGGVPPMSGPLGPEEQAILQMLGQQRAV